MKYDAVRKRIQRERASLKNKEKESVATITTTGTNKATTPKATSTAEPAAILAGIASVTAPKSTCTTNNKIAIKLLGKGDSDSPSDPCTIPGGVTAAVTNILVAPTQKGVHNNNIHASSLAASAVETAAAIGEASACTGTVLSPIFGTSSMMTRHNNSNSNTVVSTSSSTWKNTVRTSTSSSTVRIITSTRRRSIQEIDISSENANYLEYMPTNRKKNNPSNNSVLKINNVNEKEPPIHPVTDTNSDQSRPRHFTTPEMIKRLDPICLDRTVGPHEYPVNDRKIL